MVDVKYILISLTINIAVKYKAMK